MSASEKSKLLSQKKTKIFKDYAFLLSNKEHKPLKNPKLPDKKALNNSDSELTEDEIRLPFDKDQLMNQIIARGGTVLDKFEEVKDCSKPHIYLLANTYLRTMKYIMCLASGIPCIRHVWIYESCEANEIRPVSSYQLPSGYSIVEEKEIEWHNKSGILKNKRISLVSAPDSDFVDNWTSVLLEAKAELVQKSLPTFKSGASAHVDLVVTNSSCPREIVQAANRNKIPIVSIEWVIQSLIHGFCLSYEDAPKFKHDHSD